MKLPAPAADTPTFAALREALTHATPADAPRWGKMDSPQMLKHCRAFIDLYLGRVPVPWLTRLMARLLGPLFLRSAIRKSPTATPRNLTTLPGIRAAKTHDLDFAAERERLLAALAEVEALAGDHDHPLYGRMAASDVQALVRHHTAHHANQFGLLST